MTRVEELDAFLEAARREGASDEFLVNLLRVQGWPNKDIYAALGRRYEALTGLTTPRGRGAVAGARDAFLYLLAFFTLGTWATALGSLFFTYIDRAFPDPVMQRALRFNTRSETSFQMASILVALPVFLLVTRFILRQVRTNPEMLQSGVRKWLTYIALLITAGIGIGDLIAFLQHFLQGELSPRFALQVATVLVISGSIFIYYLGSLKEGAGDGDGAP